jgi:hypothetical protein
MLVTGLSDSWARAYYFNNTGKYIKGYLGYPTGIRQLVSDVSWYTGVQACV